MFLKRGNKNISLCLIGVCVWCGCWVCKREQKTIKHGTFKDLEFDDGHTAALVKLNEAHNRLLIRAEETIKLGQRGD